MHIIVTKLSSVQTGDDVNKFTKLAEFQSECKTKPKKPFKLQKVECYKGIYESTETSVMIKKSLKLTGDQGRSSQ